MCRNPFLKITLVKVEAQERTHIWIYLAVSQTDCPVQGALEIFVYVSLHDEVM